MKKLYYTTTLPAWATLAQILYAMWLEAKARKGNL